MAKLTLINHRLSEHPARALRILILESVPDVDDDLEKRFCSAFPHKYCKKRKHELLHTLYHLLNKLLDCIS